MISIFSSPIWAIEREFAFRAMPFLLKAIEKDANVLAHLPTALKVERREKYVASSILTFQAAEGMPRANASATKNVCIVPLQGVLTKNGDMCSYGMKDICEMLDQAYNDPNIDAVVIHGDGPGGDVDGIEELYNKILAKNKPVNGFIDGQAYSATYWAMSACDKLVISSGTTAWVGSIGVFTSHIDLSKAMEMEGIKVSLITAPQSTDKVNGNSYEPLSQDTINMLQARMKGVADTFIKAVQTGRGEALQPGEENIFTGKTYSGKDALKMGMVDKIGTLQDTIDMAAKQSVQQSKNNPNSNQKANQPMKKVLASIPFIGKFLGFTGEEAEITAEHIDKVEAHLAELSPKYEAAQATIADLKEKFEAAEAAMKNLETEKASLNEQVQTLEAWKEQSSQKKGAKEDHANGQSGKKVASYNQKAQEIQASIHGERTEA